MLEKRVKIGLHQTASEVVREGLRFFFKHEAEFDRQQQLRFVVTSKEELEEKLLEGIDQLGHGQGFPAHKVIADLKTLTAKRRRNG